MSKQKCQVHTVTSAKQQALSLHDSVQNSSTRHLWLQLEIQFIVTVMPHYHFLRLNLNKARLSACSRKKGNPVSRKSEYSISPLKKLPYVGTCASVKRIRMTFPPFWGGMQKSRHEMNTCGALVNAIRNTEASSESFRYFFQMNATNEKKANGCKYGIVFLFLRWWL